MYSGVSSPAISLEDCLRPIWTLTRYTGILPDWCNKDDKRGRKAKVIYHSSVFLSWILLITTAIYDIVELASEMQSTKFTLTDLFQHLMVFFLHLLNLLVQSHYILYQSLYLSFFREWQEMKLVVLKLDETVHLKIMINFTYIIYIILSCSCCCMLLVLPLYFALPKEPFTFYMIKQYFGTNTLSIYYLLVCYEYAVLLIFLFIHDVIPIIVYNHITSAIRALELEIIEIFERMLLTENILFSQNLVAKLRKCWMSYDLICQLGNRANYLFGLGIVLNQFISIVFICSTLYRLLNHLKERYMEHVEYLTLGMEAYRCFMYLFRLIYINLKLSELLGSTKRFQHRVTSLLIQHWEEMSEEERAVTMALIDQLHQNPLAAAPLGLYNISYSVFLILLSLITSNVVILLQSPGVV